MISHCFHLVSYGASQLVSVADTMTMRSNPVPFMKCAFGYTKASNRRYSVVEISPPVSKKRVLLHLCHKNRLQAHDGEDVVIWCSICTQKRQNMQQNSMWESCSFKTSYFASWLGAQECAVGVSDVKTSVVACNILPLQLDVSQHVDSVSKQTHLEGAVRPQQKTHTNTWAEILEHRILCVTRAHNLTCHSSYQLPIFWIQWWHWCSLPCEFASCRSASW